MSGTISRISDHRLPPSEHLENQDNVKIELRRHRNCVAANAGTARSCCSRKQLAEIAERNGWPWMDAYRK